MSSSDRQSNSHTSAAASSEGTFTLREILTPFFYYAPLAVLAFLVPLALAVAATFFLPTKFTADSKLVILPSQNYALQGGANANQGVLPFDRNQIIQAEMQILSSKDLQTQVIESIGVSKIYPKLDKEPLAIEKALKRFEKDLSLNNVPQSNNIELSLTNENSQIAIEVLNKLTETYISRRRDIFQRVNPTQLETQRREMMQRLNQIDAEVASFSQKYNFGNYEQALASAQTEQAALMVRLQALDEQLAAGSARSQLFGRKLDQTSPTLEIYRDRGPSLEIDDLTAKLLTLENQRRDAATKYTDNFPIVVDLDNRIEALKQQITNAPKIRVKEQRTGLNPTYESVTTSLIGAQGDVAGLFQARAQSAKDMEKSTQRLNELTSIGPAMRELLRSRGVIEVTYAELAKRTEEAKLSDRLASANDNVSVVQRAGPPVKRKSMLKPLLAAGIGLGLFCAVAAVFLASAVSQKMITPRDAEKKLLLPLAISIPFKPSNEFLAKTQVSQLGGGLMSLDECLLLLRMIKRPSEKKPVVIQLIASDIDAGVSSLSLDMAAQLSAAGLGKVLLIDVEPEAGDSLLERVRDTGVKLTPHSNQRVYNVAGSNLFVSRPAGASRMQVDEDQWYGVLTRARQVYDIVIIDTPATSESAAGIVIAPYADMTLVVIEAQETNVPVARNLIDRIETSGGQIHAALFNKRRYHIPKALYSVT
jgi:polysaccharide biosynthesis transport protein